MIEYTVDHGRVTLGVFGPLPDIEADIALLIKLVYDKVKKQDEDTASCFKDDMKRLIEDDSILFDSDVNETSIKSNELKKEVEDFFEELINKYAKDDDEPIDISGEG